MKTNAKDWRRGWESNPRIKGFADLSLTDWVPRLKPDSVQKLFAVAATRSGMHLAVAPLDSTMRWPYHGSSADDNLRPQNSGAQPRTPFSLRNRFARVRSVWPRLRRRESLRKLPLRRHS